MLQRLHLFFGIALVILFLLTGQYMHHQYDHLNGLEGMSRALFRAGHIYILLFGLIHIALGSGGQDSFHPWILRFRYAGTIAIFLASGLIIFSFFTELPATHIERPSARLALYLVLFGVSLYGTAGCISLINSDRTSNG